MDHVSLRDPTQSFRGGLNQARLALRGPSTDWATERRWIDAIKSFGSGCVNATLDAVKSGHDPAHCYERWLQAESDVGAKSTFFVLPTRITRPHHSDPSYRFSDSIVFDGKQMTVADMIREIDKRGHEIGLHPTWYTYDDPVALKQQKEQIEEIVGHEIQSVRQHYLHYDVRKTPRAHSQAGFKFDSSLGFNKNIGFRNGSSYPWRLKDLETDTELDVTEIPLTIQDGALFRSKGLELDGEHALEYIKTITEEVKAVGGVLTLLWHPSKISNDTWWNSYKELLKYLQKKGAWFGTVREVGEWWKSDGTPSDWPH